MTNEERDLISSFIARVGGTPMAGAGGFAAPTQPPAPPLPPIDREADALIGELFARYPEARYRITQTAFVQEHALIEAQNRLQRLEWELQQAHLALQQAQQQAPQPGSQPISPWGSQPGPAAATGGFLGGLFGGRAAPRPAAPYQQAYAPPPPQYPAGYNPGMFQPTGSGFFGSALRTAAGVAGGVLAADAISSLFSGHHGGGFVPSAQAGEMLPGGGLGANPWAAPAASPTGGDPFDQGGAAKQEDASGWTDASSAVPDPSGGWGQPTVDPVADPSGGWSDPGTDPAPDPSGGWSDPGGDTGGDLGGGGDDWT